MFKEVILAENAGFCFGVRAVDTSMDARLWKISIPLVLWFTIKMLLISLVKKEYM